MDEIISELKRPQMAHPDIQDKCVHVFLIFVCLSSEERKEVKTS